MSRNNLSEVAKNEKIGRDMVIRTMGNKYDFVESPDRFECWDLSGQTQHLTENKNMFVEIKYRKKYNSKNLKTAYLENLKFCWLNMTAKEYDADIYYISLFNDGWGYSFKLNDIRITDVTYTEKLLPEESSLEEGEEVKWVMKPIIEIPLTCGKKFKIK